MVQSCSVYRCNSRWERGNGPENGVGFFSYPAWKRNQGTQMDDLTKRRRMAWISAVRQKNITFNKISTHLRVCGRHFHKGKPAMEMFELDPDWAPSLHLGHTEVKASSSGRLERRKKRVAVQQAAALQVTGLPTPVLNKTDPASAPDVEMAGTDEAAQGQPLQVDAVFLPGAYFTKHGLTNPGSTKPDKPDETLHMGHTYAKPVDCGRPFPRRKWRQAAVVLRDPDPAGDPDPAAAATALDVEAVCNELNRLSEENTTLKEKLSQMQNDNIAREQCDWETECGLCSLRRGEINRLLEENRNLMGKLAEHRMDRKFLENNDKRVNYYTGLPSYALLSEVATHVLPLLPQSGHKLSPFQMLFLTLARLRLNIPREHLAHLFRISDTSVSTVFNNTLSAMYTELGAFVNWPGRKALVATMPHQFVEAFGTKVQVAVVVDCFEILMDKPSKHKDHAETFSYNKQSNTMKYLIGITPNGAISFISKGWGGRSTDKEVTQNCGIFDKLLPGDVVLAGRGFDITDGVGSVCAAAEVKTPVSAGQCGQLRAVGVAQTPHMPWVRSHVGRVIRVVRNKYTFLNGTMPTHKVFPIEGHEMTILDKIVHVCCALTNFCPGVLVKLP